MYKKNKIKKIKNVGVDDKVQALIYCRVSSAKQSIEGHGLEGQELRCRTYAQSKGYQVEKVFHDSFTGGGDFMNRPAMAEMIAYIQKNSKKRYVVIFDDLKRFARDTEFHIKLRAIFKVLKVELECLNFNFEDSAVGKFTEIVIAAAGELERKQNANQVTQKMKARMEAGYWTFGSKRGYKLVKSPVHGKLAVLDQKDAEILKIALEGFARGIFVRKLDACTYLRENGFYQKQRPEKYIDNFTSLLMDPFYAGFIEYPKWGVERRPGHHQALISVETFELNKKRLSEKDLGQRVRADLSDDFPLRGLIVCSACGGHLTAAWSKGRNKKYPYYICHGNTCYLYRKFLKREDVEGRFDEVLKSYTIRPFVTKVAVVVFDKTWEKSVEDVNKAQMGITKQRKSLEEQINDLSLAAAKTDSEIARKVYEEKIEKVVAQLEGLPEAIVLVKDDTEIPYRTALEKVMMLLKKPYKAWKKVSNHEKKTLFYFMFNQKLPYDEKDGYRTAKKASYTMVFEDFATQSPYDVEMAGLNPRPGGYDERVYQT